MVQNIYQAPPRYETSNFILRLVEGTDAADLLHCYSDVQVRPNINPDNCTGDFFCRTLEQMEETIAFWQKEYARGAFLRLSIVDKESKKAVGTVEVFGGEYGVLRVDLEAAYEKTFYLGQLLALAIGRFIPDLGIGTLVIRRAANPERTAALKEYDFRPSKDFRPEIGYCAYPALGIGCCGLACILCREKASCAGCLQGGCGAHESCVNFNCCLEKGIKGCWQCAEFPCEKSIMLKKPRIRAFARFAKEWGETELIARLLRNQAQGIVYHGGEGLTGDYDACSCEAEIMQLIQEGKR